MVRIHASAALPPGKGPSVPHGGPHGPHSCSGLTKQGASPRNRTAGPRSFSPLCDTYTDRAAPAVAVFVHSWHI